MLYHYPPTSTTTGDGDNDNYLQKQQQLQLEQGGDADNFTSAGRRAVLRGTSDTTKMRQVYDWDEGVRRVCDLIIALMN